MSRTILDRRLKPPNPATIIGSSPWAMQVRSDVQVVAHHASTVLVTGPSGTGKELIARSIHSAGDRACNPFVPVDCAAASDTLFTSQLFGHVKGAFTGASHESLGALRAAEGGTVFLDEIGELDLSLQAKLLRTLQQRLVVPVGGLHEIAIDVRVVAATNRDLRSEVARGRFREDLFYRLSVVCLETQPLRMRREDIPELVDSILARLQIQQGIGPKQVTDAAMNRLRLYSWPGNVRELANVLERAALFSHEFIDIEHLSHEVRCGSDAIVPCSQPGMEAEFLRVDDGSEWPTMDDVERWHLARTLRRTGYNQSAAAKLLGLDRNAIRRLAIRLSVQTPGKR